MRLRAREEVTPRPRPPGPISVPLSRYHFLLVCHSLAVQTYLQWAASLSKPLELALNSSLSLGCSPPSFASGRYQFVCCRSFAMDQSSSLSEAYHQRGDGAPRVGHLYSYTPSWGPGDPESKPSSPCGPHVSALPLSTRCCPTTPVFVLLGCCLPGSRTAGARWSGSGRGPPWPWPLSPDPRPSFTSSSSCFATSKGTNPACNLQAASPGTGKSRWVAHLGRLTPRGTAGPLSQSISTRPGRPGPHWFWRFQERWCRVMDRKSHNVGYPGLYGSPVCGSHTRGRMFWLKDPLSLYGAAPFCPDFVPWSPNPRSGFSLLRLAFLRHSASPGRGHYRPIGRFLPAQLMSHDGGGPRAPPSCLISPRNHFDLMFTEADAILSHDESQGPFCRYMALGVVSPALLGSTDRGHRRYGPQHWDLVHSRCCDRRGGEPKPQ